MGKFESLITENFLAALAATLKIRLTRAQGEAVRLIANQLDKYAVTDEAAAAYVLATAYHECRFKAIAEIRAKPGTDIWRMQNRYWYTGFYGRGFVQLTWRKNYLKFSKILGLDLVKNPDLVLLPAVGATILVLGMRDGLFSGVGLSKYFKPGTADYIGARAIVNGTFHADKVAAAAQKIHALLIENAPKNDI